MSHNLLLNASFHQQLLQLDFDFMLKSRLQGCRFCGGSLQQSHYPRVPFGIPPSMRHFYDRRLSLCCAQCRRRTTPQSVRFLGPRRFMAFVMVLIPAQHASPDQKRIDRLRIRFGIHFSLTTWQRWRAWWKDQFPASRLWLEVRGLFVHQDDLTRFPRSLLKRLGDHRLIRLLKLIAPFSVQFT